MFFIQTFTSTQNMHRKPTEHGSFLSKTTRFWANSNWIKGYLYNGTDVPPITIWTNIIILELLQLDKIALFGTWSKLDNYKFLFIYMTPQTYSSFLNFLSDVEARIWDQNFSEAWWYSWPAPSVSKSNRFHVVIFQLFFASLKFIP